MKLTEREKEIIRELRKKEIYSIGDEFFFNGEKFVLCQVAYRKVCAVSTGSWNRYRDAVEVNNIFEITEKEFEDIIS